MNRAVAAQVVCRAEAHLKNPFHATASAQRVNPRGHVVARTRRHGLRGQREHAHGQHECRQPPLHIA